MWSIPFSFFTLVCASSKLYYLQRLGFYSDPQPSMRMIFSVLPLQFFYLLGPALSLCLLATYYKLYTLVVIVAAMAIHGLFSYVVFFTKSQKADVCKYIFQNQQEISRSETFHTFYICVLTSWISPSTVWTNNSVLNSRMLLSSAFISFLSNSIATATLFFDSDTFAESVNPPIFKCFTTEVLSQINKTGYEIVHKGNMSSLFLENNFAKPKMRICQNGESSTDVLFMIVIPFVYAMLVLSFLSGVGLQYFGNYEHLFSFQYKFHKVCLPCPQLFYHFYISILFDLLYIKEGSRTFEIQKKIDSARKMVQQNRNTFQISAWLATITFLENTKYLAASGKVKLESIKMMYPEILTVDYQIRATDKIWENCPPMHQAATMGHFGRWCFFNMIGGEAAALNGQKSSSFTGLLAFQNSDMNFITKWWYTKADRKYGRNAFFNALRSNDIQSLELLLANGYDANLKDGDRPDSSALHYCTEKGKLDFVKLLCRFNANVNSKNKDGETPIHVAVKQNKFKCLKLLIDYGASVNEKSSYVPTPLELAFYQGNLECFKILTDHGADINVQDKYGNTLLHHAAEAGKLNLLKLLVEKKADLDVRNNLAHTPLHRAATEDHLECFKALADAGADLNVADKDGDRLAFFAYAHKKFDFLNLLVHKGVDLNAKDKNGETLLNYATRDGNLQLVKLLLEKGALVNGCNKMNKTPLHIAAETVNLQCVKLLAANKEVDFNAKDVNGESPLFYATKSGDIEIQRFMISKGADLSIKDVHGKTLLHVAAENGNVNSLRQFLMQKRRLVNEKNNTLDTPVHVAAKFGHLECLKALVNDDANLAAKNDNEDTCLMLAVQHDHFECLKFLTEKGASLGAQNKAKESLLHVAARSGSATCLKFLADKGANLEAKNALNETPLMTSVRHGHKGPILQNFFTIRVNKL